MADAPGWPGIEPRWTSSAKTGVGAALSLGQPRLVHRQPRHPERDLLPPRGPGLHPRFRPDRHRWGRLLRRGKARLQLRDHRAGGRRARPSRSSAPISAAVSASPRRIVTDPRHDVVLQQIRLEVLEGPPLRLFALLAPHLVNAGAHNTRLGRRLQGPPHAVRRGRRARPRAGRGPAVRRHFGRLRRRVRRLADPARPRPTRRTIRPRRRRQRRADRRTAGGWRCADPAGLGFGRSGRQEAAFHARASLQAAFASTLERYTTGWRTWQAGLRSLDRHVGRAQHLSRQHRRAARATKARRSPAA